MNSQVDSETSRTLVDTAMGRMPADLLIRKGRWVCVQSGEIIPAIDVDRDPTARRRSLAGVVRQGKQRDVQAQSSELTPVRLDRLLRQALTSQRQRPRVGADNALHAARRCGVEPEPPRHGAGHGAPDPIVAAIAVIMVLSAAFDTLLIYIGFTLSLFASLTVIGLMRIRKMLSRSRSHE